MQKLSTVTFAIIITGMFLISSCNHSGVSYTSNWEYQPDRIWAGPEFWANRLQDWRLEDGKLNCVNSELSLRTVHLLTYQIDTTSGEFEISLTLGLNPKARKLGSDGWAGILIGAGEGQMDYRASALIHHSTGKAGGLIIAVNEYGQIVFMDNTNKREALGPAQHISESSYPDSLLLKIDVYLNEDSTYTISASATDILTHQKISQDNLTKISKERIVGNIALASNHIEKNFIGANYWFEKLSLKGTNISFHPEHRFGPFMGIQYTLSKNILKLTAQLPPIGAEDASFVRMWIREKGALTWQEIDSSTIRRDAFIACFRIEALNSTLDHEYRLSYDLPDLRGNIKTYYFTGIVNADPVDKPELVVGAFACISHMEGNINGMPCDYPDRIWFPHTKFIESVKAQKPDILFFMGDQIYEARPTPPDYSSPENTELDYLYKWYIFLWSTRELMRNTPTICIPDDHDVYHGNLWGDGGKAAPAYPLDSIYPDYYKGFESHWQQDQGGYKLRASTVNMIQATQTSQLPDPYDPEPVEQGIGVYYTDLNYGRVSFAIIEDRKFKSAPSLMLPQAKVVNGFAQNRYISGRGLDNPNAHLLGDRQLDFIKNWTADWTNTDMKATISQTIFADLSTYPDTFKTDEGTPLLMAPPPGIIPKGFRLAKDMDSNGWPQTARKKALNEIRKGFAIMIGGDQHLGSLIQMGTDTWDDAGYSFCVPAIGNLWPRRWFPQEAGLDHINGMPLYTGKYFDGFGNRMNVWAVANPVKTGKEPAALYNRSVGYGIIRFNKTSGEITFECWKRDGLPAMANEGLYPGWPKTIRMMENYSRVVRSWLPNYHVSGLDHKPVFQVIDEANGEIIYTVRVPENNYQPGVFSYGGEYTVRIGDPDTDLVQVFEHVRSRYLKNEEPVMVNF